jgi:rubrerythrin
MKRLISNFEQEPLNELSEADVKSGKCPVCNMSGLKSDNGIKICPYCNSTFKMFRGKIYLI